MPDTTKVKELTTKLEQGVKDLFRSDRYAEYLKTMSRFHKYSTRNTLLIHMQRPDATLVAGFRSWQDKFSRNVKKGEKAIKIFAPVPFTKREEKEKLDPETRRPVLGEDGTPIIEYTERQLAFFKVTNVFDVKQTDGKPLPTLAQDLEGNVEQYEAFMDALREISPLPIVFEKMPDNADGFCVFGDRIALREGMSQIQTVSAAIHEITHAKLHDMESLRLMDEKAVPKDRRTEEVEAESVSYAVCQYFGIETGDNSFGYIMEWSRSRELKELNASLDAIRKTAAELIEGIDGKFKELVKERDINLAVGEMQIESSEHDFEEPTIDATEPQADTQKTIPPSGTVYARYCNQISDVVKADGTYANAVLGDILNISEEAARAECQAAIKRAVDNIYEESSEHLHLFLYHSEDENFRARLEDYVFIRAFLEPRTELMNAAAQIAPAPEMSLEEILNDREEMIRRIMGDILKDDPDFPVKGLEGMEDDYRSAPIEGLREAYFFYFPNDPPTIEQEAAPVNETPTEPAISPQAAELIAEYARNAKVSNPPRVGAGTLMPPLFVDGNYNRTGKKIRVIAEEPIGKYQIFSREEHDAKTYYFLTASGMIDRLNGYFRDEWNEETRKYEPYLPSETELDGIMPIILERFEQDMANPEKFAMYQHAAVLNRLDECDAHNVPVRELQKEKNAKRREEAEQAKLEEERQYKEKYDARVDEIAKAIENGETIDVAYNEYSGQKNPVLDLFKLYDIALPLKTQGWVNKRLAEINKNGCRYFSSKGRGKSEVFGSYLEQLRRAIKATPIEQKRQPAENVQAPAQAADTATEAPQKEPTEKKTAEHKLFDKFEEIFPQFTSGDFNYLKFEAGDGFMPLSLEYLYGGRISLMHTYILNGDSCYDPMMEFDLNSKNRTLSPCTFEQSIPPIYQYFDGDGNGMSADGNGNNRAALNLQSELNDFATMWLSNISQQGYMPVLGDMVLGKDNEVRVTFDSNGNPIMPEPEKPENQYELDYGHFGNGLTVWNRLEKKDGDYVTVAHIDPNRTVSFRDKDMPDHIKAKINIIARTSDARVSTSQPEQRVFHTPPEPCVLKHNEIPVDGTEIYNQFGEKIANVIENGRIEYFSDTYITEQARGEIETFAKATAEKREAEFLNMEGNAYGIYLFEPTPDNSRVTKENYRLAWFGELSEGETLDTIKNRFKNEPDLHYDFHKRENGIPLGNGDIIVMKENGEITPWFVNELSFAKENNFFTPLESPDLERGEESELDLPMPDPAIGFSEMNLHGYDWEGMLPLTQGRATELFDAGHSIYRLYEDNAEGLMCERKEITDHDGLFGIERDEWARSPVLAAQLAVAKNAEGSREAELLHGTTHDGMFGIYQISDGIDEARNFRFTPMRELEARGLTPDRANYKLVHTAPLDIRDTLTNLNKIFKDFNSDERPADFAGRSVSVSDIIVLQWRGEVSSHYVDSAGFVELNAFLGEESQNPSYSQVGNKQGEYTGPTTAELEADVNAGKAISITDLANAIKAEQNNKQTNPRHAIPAKSKPTLMERLEEGKRKAARHGQPDAQKTKHKEELT